VKPNAIKIVRAGDVFVDRTEDLKIIDVPTLVIHSDVPIADSTLLSAKLLKKGTLKV
jgi:non-heme chloroperoxidase